ncbi:hypothetical protein LPJ66_007618 [Kickxella alabastrina]|uniref:Uncharacterized protein n=1 Tax=Kickxella alabastrina TaxID=61397 RepID=A0ACC1IAP3_9FUNG|nr:hypothetical protein LPJ66_007618 [Kickxella alabastrina]
MSQLLLLNARTRSLLLLTAPKSLTNLALRPARWQQQHQHQHKNHQHFHAPATPKPSIQKQIDTLIDQATKLSNETWTTSAQEQQGTQLMSQCCQWVANGTVSATQDIRRICHIADHLAHHILQRNKTSFNPALFVKYLELYATLGRPDITQRAFSRISTQWRRPSMHAYAAQQLALLRFSGDRVAKNTPLLRATLDAEDPADVILRRLDFHTVTGIVEDAVRRERRTRRLIKMLEYGSYTAMGVLVAKWAWIGNSVVLAGLPLVPKILASAAALLAAAACVRLVLRHSIMGSLTTPLLSSMSDSPGKPVDDIGAEPLSEEIDSEARRILRRAFPASPSDEAMMEINEIISAASSSSAHKSQRLRLSWKLRLALSWSKFARRYAVVEPSLISQHDLRQRLAVQWLRNITHMFAHKDSHSTLSPGTVRVASESVIEFADFVKTHFATIPLALTQDDIVVMSRFIADEANPKAICTFLDLAAAGNLVLVRDTSFGPGRETLFTSATAAESEGTAAMIPEAELHKRQASATILTFGACIGHLLRLPSERTMANESILGALNKLIDIEDTPISASLCRSAFAAATTPLFGASLKSRLEKSQNLIDWLEERHRRNDPYLIHILGIKGDRSLAKVGWTPRGGLTNEPTLPIVSCVTQYIALLTRMDSASGVHEFVSRWYWAGILSPTASVQCLAAAIHDIVSSHGTKSLYPDNTMLDAAESWASLGCSIAATTITTPASANSRQPSSISEDELASPLYILLTETLNLCQLPTFKNPKSCNSGLRIFTTWRASTDRSPHLLNHATLEFNMTALRFLVSQAQNDSKNSAMYVRLAANVLDLMRALKQTPVLSVVDDLHAADSAGGLSGVDVSEHIRFWTEAAKKKKQSNNNSNKMTSFAKSLL